METERMKIIKLSPNEKIVGLDNLTLGDFWSWAYSDLLSNRNRSVLAEFLVGSALGVIDVPRVEWDAYDFLYRGSKIEVKSAAYLQSWEQKSLSRITFDISKKKSWYAENNTWESESRRAADCYVFCLYSETDPVKVNVLNVSAWQFYIKSTKEIDREFGNQKRIGLKKIQSRSSPVDYDKLKEHINMILDIKE